MAYLQSIRAQAAIFLATIGFGFLLGAAYDLLRLVRLLTNARRIAVWDVGYGALAGAATFLFMLTQNGGKVRVFLLAALGVGFAVWYFFAGVPIRKATDDVLRAGRRAAACVRRPFAYLAQQLRKKRNNLCSALKKTVKKLQKNRKSS